jgi:hypothetical protein
MGNCSCWEAGGRISTRGVALLGLTLVVLVSPGLRAQTSVTYAVGAYPAGIAFDGVNIWVSNSGDGTVTKLLASTGATVGTYPVAALFDGVNIWVTNSRDGTVTKLLAATGATVGTYPAGKTPQGITFDGVNILVPDASNYTVTKILAATGDAVGSYTVPASLCVGGECDGCEPPFGIVFDGAEYLVDKLGRRNCDEAAGLDWGYSGDIRRRIVDLRRCL